MDASGLTDVDDPTTWPPAVYERSLRWAESLRGTTEYTSDLELPLEEEDPFRELFEGKLLLAYHATRLLDLEVGAIRTGGLRLASEDLVHTRIEMASKAGLIDEELHNVLLKGNVFAEDDAHNRKDQICFVLSRKPFDHASNFGYLLTEWGGELITMSGGGAAVRPQLRKLGRPAIIVAAINLSESERVHAVYPYLHKLFVGRLLDLEDLGADVFYRSAVPAEHIIDIWQPGHPQYDRHTELPIV